MIECGTKLTFCSIGFFEIFYTCGGLKHFENHTYVLKNYWIVFCFGRKMFCLTRSVRLSKKSNFWNISNSIGGCILYKLSTLGDVPNEHVHWSIESQIIFFSLYEKMMFQNFIFRKQLNLKQILNKNTKTRRNATEYIANIFFCFCF